MQNRTFWVVASAAIGGLQAWDSGVAAAGTVPLALTALGIGAPTLAIAMSLHHGWRIAALVAGAILLVGARLLSPVTLNTLHFSLFPAAMYILIVKGLGLGASRQTA
jgi:hypothetical protein